MVRCSRTARPTKKPDLRGNVLGAGIGPWWATMARKSPATLWIAASKATQKRAALAAIDANASPRSIGELEITLRISAVAVCCSRASASSRLNASTDLSPAASDGMGTLNPLDIRQIRVRPATKIGELPPTYPTAVPGANVGSGVSRARRIHHQCLKLAHTAHPHCRRGRVRYVGGHLTCQEVFGIMPQ